MGAGQRPVFGPNDHNMASGSLQPGLGDEEEARIRRARGDVVLEEPPAKAELRRQAEDLKAKAKQLSLVERELEKERASSEERLAAREAAVAEREAQVAAALKDLEA